MSTSKRSISLGIMLGAIVFLAMSQVAVTPSLLLRVEYLPHPRDMVQIREGTPFQVPAGKIFVLTGLGSKQDNYGSNAQIQVNGQDELRALGVNSNYVGVTVQEVPPGFTVAAGNVLTVIDGLSGDFARAWGYLADQ